MAQIVSGLCGFLFSILWFVFILTPSLEKPHSQVRKFLFMLMVEWNIVNEYWLKTEIIAGGLGIYQ